MRRLQYPDLEIVVVDNAPSDDSTRREVAAAAEHDTRIRYVVEPVPGLSNARNRALTDAGSEIVAFTDDDVEVDPLWVDALGRAFAADREVACVTGLVPSARLDTPAEHLFDRKVSWSTRCTRGHYTIDMACPPFKLFPFAAGHFGTGANFAVRRDVMLELGGFDPALGAGAPTRGGEDLDAFLRVLLGGRSLRYEPSAIVWHHHRSDMPQLRKQIFAYGLGCTAYLTKHLLRAQTRRAMLTGAPHAIAGMTRTWQEDMSEAMPRSLMALEALGMVVGPFVYARTRWQQRRRRAGARRGTVRADARATVRNGAAPTDAANHRQGG